MEDTLNRNCALVVLAVLCSLVGYSQSQQPLSVPPDSPRWDLEGTAKVAEFGGRKAILLDGGAAVLKDFVMRDGVIDVDVATTAVRGFLGFDIRIPEDGSNYEEI